MALYSNLFILAKAQLFSLSFLYIKEEPPPPRSTPWGAYRSSTSCEAVPPSICLQHHTFTYFTHSYLVVRSINSLGSIQVFHLVWSSASLYLPSEPHVYLFHTHSHSYPTLNNNVGKFNLPHIWDRVLINTPGLKLNK